MSTDSRRALGAGILLLLGLSAPAPAFPGTGPATSPAEEIVYEEAPRDAPAERIPRNDPLARSAGLRVATGPFVSVQVNVDGSGMNIVGDAANEPSIALSPTDPDVIVIGWRQFDSVASDFRQAGWAYTTDGGETWTFPGVLEPGVFRSDPVLDADGNGNVYYQSLSLVGNSLSNEVFESLDGGHSWLLPTPAFGGDKNWMVIDRTGGRGDGHVYGIWQGFAGCCAPNSFTRSTDGAASFETPIQVARAPLLGTLAVGPQGEVYAAGVDGTAGQDLRTIVVARSLDAQDAQTRPTFSGVEVDLGGKVVSFTGPNPEGLLGQVNVAADRSAGPTRGNVYILASVDPEPFNEAFDPLDVHFARSTDGGVTWSAPVRVNNDPPGQGAWHWFGAMSVAPNGRIDVVWNDTRNGLQLNHSELFYAYSYDAGATWFGNVPVSPTFDSHVGWPNQLKLGDYYDIVSDAAGAHVAYAATFNGEQDVYYLRLRPDCNGNGRGDDLDVESGLSADCNGNLAPDECELAAGSARDCNRNGLLDACDIDAGTSDDCDGNRVADECEPDCNGNGVADACDIADGLSADCSGNGVPDECEPDCNGNGSADSCDIADGLSGDCSTDGVPDECEPDCDADGVPDPCSTRLRFAAHDVARGPDGPQSVAVADLDGDGDDDVLATSINDGAIAWYANTDGAGGFGPRNLLASEPGAAVAVIAADVDGDGDVDALSASLNDRLAWYENLDGAGGFGAQRLISAAADGPVALRAADLDGDGDTDLLSASINDNEVAWYENLDGAGSFGAQRIISTAGNRPRTVFAADLDGDGDSDVVAAWEVDDTVVWYANTDGAGTFGPPQLVTAAVDRPFSLFAEDLDGDGDPDIVSASADDGRFAWYENLHGDGTFGPRRILGQATPGVVWVWVDDLDGDGDPDVLTTSFNDDEVGWHENLDGRGSFGPRRIVSLAAHGVWAAVTADLDSDADVDIVHASFLDDAVGWLENLSDDCNANGVPDSCEPDCDGNGTADSCDLRLGAGLDCDGNGLLDVCDTSCVESCDTDGDGCLDDSDADPLLPDLCGDSDGDGCDDCTGGAFDPAGDGANADSDGVCDPGDCDPADNRVWSDPAAVTTLVLGEGGFRTLLTWAPPVTLGALGVRYDTLRSRSPGDFLGPVVCLDADETDTQTLDVELPAPGSAFHYLVRVENDCPGSSGTLGAGQGAGPRAATACTSDD